MPSTTKKSVCGLLLTGALFCFADCSFTTVAAQDSVEATILEEELRQASRYYEQRRHEDARVQQQFERKQRLAMEFESFVAKAKAQHAKIRQWEKNRPQELKAQAQSDHIRKRVQMVTILPQ